MRRLAQRMLVILLAAGCALSLAACSSSDSAQGSSKADADKEVKTVTDAYDREVEVPSDVSAAATVGSAARFVVYAGGVEKLAAITEEDATPSMDRPYTMACRSIFADLPTTSQGDVDVRGAVDTDALIDLNPDVIISSGDAKSCDSLQELTGIPVLGVLDQDQVFTGNVYSSIECVGEALGTEEDAQASIAKLQECSSLVANRTGVIPSDEIASVYFGGIDQDAGNGWGATFGIYPPAEPIEVQNVAADAGFEGPVSVDLEEVVQWNPHYIFFDRESRDALVTEYQANREVLDGLSAVQQGHLYALPTLISNGTNVATGACQAYFIAATVYPELFEDIDLAEKYTDMYKTLLNGFDFYKLLVDQDQGFGALQL